MSWRGAATGHVAKDFFPGVQIHLRQIDVGAHARFRRGHGLARLQTHADAAAQHPGLRAADIAHVVERHQAAQAERELILQRAPRRHRRGHQRVVIAQRQRGFGGFAQRRRQVQRHALQAA